MRHTGVTSRYQRRRAYLKTDMCYIGNRCIQPFVQSSFSLSFSISLSVFLPARRTIDKLGGQNHRVRTILRPFCVRGASRAKPNVPLTSRYSTCQHYTVLVTKRGRVLPHTPFTFTALPLFNWIPSPARIKETNRSYELFMSFQILLENLCLSVPHSILWKAFSGRLHSVIKGFG